MASVREYLLGVITAAVICGIVTSLTKNTAGAALIRLISGIFLTVCVLSPVHHVELDDLLSSVTPDLGDIQGELADARNQALDTLRHIIKEKTEAYILDKAAQMGARITAEVSVSDADIPVPEAILLRGSPSPYIRLKLEQLIVQELGIPEEAQTWIG